MSDSARKKVWRRNKGRAYADTRNVVARKYQKTFLGWLARKAGSMNVAAKFRGAGGRISAGDLLRIWVDQNGIDARACRCAGCGQGTTGWEFDHAVPLFKNGEHCAANIQILCPACHTAKSASERSVYGRVDMGDTHQQDLFTAATEPTQHAP